MCEYGFVENQDYCTLYQDTQGSILKNEYACSMNKNQMSGKGISVNHAIKLDMAKVDVQKRTRTYGNQDYILVVQKRTINNPKKQTEGR